MLDKVFTLVFSLIFLNCDVNPISWEMETFGLQSVSSIGLVRMDRILLKRHIT